jgi:hypothetical protein
MKKSLASLIIALAFVSSAQGAVVINAVETGGNVVFTGTGILSTLAWDQDWGTIDFAAVEPNQANIWVGETPAVNSFRFINPDYFTGPTNFGAGGRTNADSGSGGDSDGSGANDIFGLLVNSPIPILVVPGGYIQETDLFGLSTYNNVTLAGLGMNVGSYTWTWGRYNTADSLTLNVGSLNPVPIPAAIWLFGTVLIGLVGFSKRKSKVAA